MPRRFLLFLLCAALALPAPLAWGQSTDFASALSGTTRPLTIKVKDLDSSWRQMTVAKSTGMDLFSLFALGSRAQGPKLDLYYTRGETVIAGGETFLVRTAACQAPPCWPPSRMAARSSPPHPRRPTPSSACLW